MLTPLEYLQPNATDSELPLGEEMCGRPQADGENTFIRASGGGGFREQRESGRVWHDTDEVRFGSAYRIKVDEGNAVILDCRPLSSIASITWNYRQNRIGRNDSTALGYAPTAASGVIVVNG